MQTGATFDTTGQYRYTLWRAWDRSRSRVGFIMLNPSQADATNDDPTLRRCLGFARAWGYGSLEVVNLFAYRTANPRHLQQVADPIGKDNDRILQTLGDRVDDILLAWGNGGTLYHRHHSVLNFLPDSKLYCLGLTKLGQPRHPLYLRADLQPLPFG